jgi:hypothetical protein
MLFLLTLIQIQYKSRLVGKLKQRVKALIDRFFQFSNLYENDENFKELCFRNL